MISLKHIALVVIGSGTGGALRYVISILAPFKTTSRFPWSTFIVNVIGSLMMGLVIALLSKNTKSADEWKLLLTTGFCGGFTTFSAFAAENLALMKNGDYLNAFIYMILSLVLGIGAVAVGSMVLK